MALNQKEDVRTEQFAMRMSSREFFLQFFALPNPNDNLNLILTWTLTETQMTR